MVVVVANATCLTKSERGLRNSSWQGARSKPVVGLSLEHYTGDNTNWISEIPRRDDRLRHHLSPPPQFRYETERKLTEIFSSPLHS
ncbi:hypothetical protein TNCV_616251 [Trichonephila clavipes]|nr:hypothetical protein TNCV_616251 [Trichonephila clavipes]